MQRARAQHTGPCTHSLTPFAVCVQLWWNFTAYKARFGAVMPYAASGSSNPLYYSFNVGEHFHFTGFNTETALDTADVDATQVAWLHDVLGSPAAHNARWRIAYAHRPIYW